MGRSSRSSRRRQISAEPLINFVHRRLEWLLVAGVTLFIVYATCLPTTGDDELPEGNSLLSLAFSKQDFVQNILLYVPLGFFLSLACRRHRTEWHIVAMVTLAASATMSGLAEFGQHFLPGRISSLTDLFCNIFGAASGGLAAYFFRVGTRSFRHHLRDLLAHQPIFLSFVLTGALYSFLSLIPFQLDLTPKTDSTLLNPVRLAAFTPTRAAEVHPQAHTARGQYDHTLDLAAALACFALIGFLACRSLEEELDFTAMTAGLAALWMIFLLSILLAVGQMFLHRRGFQIIFVPVSVIGASIGVLASCGLGRTVARSLGRLALWSWPALMFCLALILGRELSPFEFDFSPAAITSRVAQVSWIPFSLYFSSGQISAASSDILAKFGRFFVFGILICMSLRSAKVYSFNSRLRVGLWVTLLLSLAIEVLQVGCPTRYLDVTHVLLASVGTVCGVIAIQWWLDLIKAHRPRRDNRAAITAL